MKRTFLLPCIILIIALSGFSIQSEPTTIQINKKGFFVNETAIAGAWEVNLFESQFGKADRDIAGTLIYDDDGIKLFKEYKDGKYIDEVSEFQVFYGPVPTEKNLPKNFFSGNVTVEKLNVTAGLNPQAVRSALKKWNTKDSYVNHAYRYDNGKVYIYFTFNDEENQLIQLSIGRI